MKLRQQATHYFKDRRGQAAVETAIFGSVFLFVLGMLVKYGMSLNYQQDAKMYAFRNAQAWSIDANAAFDGSPSFTLTTDRHIPDPQDSFGVGRAAPISDTASVSWTNHQSWTTPGKGDEPRMIMEFIDENIDSTGQKTKTGYLYGGRDDGLFGDSGNWDKRTITARILTGSDLSPYPSSQWAVKDQKNKIASKRHDWVLHKDLFRGDEVDIGDECQAVGLNPKNFDTSSVEYQKCAQIRKTERIITCNEDDKDSHCKGDYVLFDYQGGAIDMTVSDYDIRYALDNGLPVPQRQGIGPNITTTGTVNDTYLYVNQEKGSLTHLDTEEETARTIVRNKDKAAADLCPGGCPDLQHTGDYKIERDFTNADWQNGP